MKVTTAIEYALIEKSTSKTVLTKTIATPFTATFSDAAIAAIRLKIANEGSARKNIEELLDALLSLNIKETEVSIAP